MRIEVYIVKFKTHSRGYIREYLKHYREVSNTEHVVFHCPSAKFIWDLVMDKNLIILETLYDKMLYI